MIAAMIAKRRAKQKFEARNRGDIDTFLDDWAEDVVYIFPGRSSLSGTFHGLDAARGWFRQFRQQFTAIHFDLQQVFVSNLWALGANNDIAVYWMVKLQDETQHVYENAGVTVVKLRNGKVKFVQDFIFDLSPSFFEASLYKNA